MPYLLNFLRYHRDSSTSSVTSTEEEECVERCLKRRNLTSAWTSSTDIATDLSDITTSANNNNSNTLSSLSSPSSSNSNSSSSAFCVFQRKKRKLSRCRIADYSCFPMMSDSQAPHQSQQQQSCSSSAPLFTRARYQFDTSIISRHFNGYNNIINHTNNDDHPPISEHLSYNKRIVFIKRPGENNFPTVDCFHCEECPAPNQSDVDDGQCIIRTLFLSVDPAQRCRMNRSTGVDYLEPFEPGELVDGLEGIGVVEMASPACNFEVGDLVTSVGRLWPWSRLFVADHSDLVKVNLPRGYSPSIILSCVGISGMTALLGIRKKAAIDPTKPQTIVVSGAAGSCGSLAGQIARLDGCTRVVGICGAPEKCEVLMNELGFDGAINYKAESVPDRLRTLAPDGVDIYFDNVGGFVSDAVIAQMNQGGRVVLCGQIAVYNTNLPYPPPIPEKTAEIIAERGIRRERYIVLSYKDDLDSTIAQLSTWLQEKKLKVKETIYEGLERAPEAFVDMMRGKNIGKMMVKVE